MNRNTYNRIGVLDSGIGGLTVLHELLLQFGGREYIYFGDTKNLPYGSRSDDEIRRLSLEMVTFLLDQKVDLIVVACHTISANALEYLKKNSPVPVIGVITGTINHASRMTQNGIIGLMATPATIKSQIYRQIFKAYNDIMLIESECPLLAQAIEAYNPNSPQIENLIAEYLNPFKEKNVDSIIIGCTHYSYALSVIQKIAGAHVQLITAQDSILELFEKMLPTLAETASSCTLYFSQATRHEYVLKFIQDHNARVSNLDDVANALSQKHSEIAV